MQLVSLYPCLNVYFATTLKPGYGPFIIKFVYEFGLWHPTDPIEQLMKGQSCSAVLVNSLFQAIVPLADVPLSLPTPIPSEFSASSMYLKVNCCFYVAYNEVIVLPQLTAYLTLKSALFTFPLGMFKTTQ